MAKKIVNGSDKKAGIVVVASISGNVGKSTIAYHCVYAHAPGDAECISVETINDGINDVAQFQGKDVEGILERALIEGYGRPVVIDVGVSNIEAFMLGVKLLGPIITEEIGLWVIPFIPERKFESEIGKTVSVLLDMGINKTRIVAMGNRVTHQTHEETTRIALDLNKTFGIGAIIPLPENDIYGRVPPNQFIRTIAEDATDYRNAMASAKDVEERRQLLNRRVLVQLARSADADLEASAIDIWRRI